jgi:hypothetical protein
MSSDSRSTALKTPNFFVTPSMRSSGTSVTSTRGSGFGNSSAMILAGAIAAAR